MDLFSMPSYNGKYLRPNTAKPIAGVCTLTAFKRPLVSAKVVSDYAVPGTAVAVKTAAAGAETNAGRNLNPNVMLLDGKTKVTAGTFSGFLCVSATDVQPDGSKGAFAVKNQIVDVALLGSGAELYLPIDAAPADRNVVTALNWDTATNKLTVRVVSNTVLAVTGLKVLSQVVDGIMLKYTAASNTATYEETSVVKVRLG